MSQIISLPDISPSLKLATRNSSSPKKLVPAQKVPLAASEIYFTSSLSTSVCSGSVVVAVAPPATSLLGAGMLITIQSLSGSTPMGPLATDSRNSSLKRTWVVYNAGHRDHQSNARHLVRVGKVFFNLITKSCFEVKTFEARRK